MPADTSVKHFHSALTGAPTLNGTAGALIALLDACLVNGFGSGTLDSLVIAGNVATATRSAGHPYEVDSVVEISGATVSGGTINGQHRVTAITTTTYQFETTGIADQTATGTISAKFAAAGWAKVFSGTNLAVYRSPDVTGTRFYLRVDDTGTTNARVVAYESMSDVNTGTNAYPTSSQVSGGLYWPKSNSADSSSRRWLIFADAKRFHYCNQWSTGAGEYPFSIIGYFGDVLRAGTTDSYYSMIFGPGSSITGNTPGSVGAEYELSSIVTTISTPPYIARPASGIGTSQPLYRHFPTLGASPNTSVYSGGSAQGMGSFPNQADNGLYAVRIMLGTSLTAGFNVYRGEVPGLYAVPQAVGANVLSPRLKFDSIANLTGRKLMAVNSFNGVSLFDITGPWG